MLYNKFISRHFNLNEFIDFRLSQHGIAKRIIKFVQSNSVLKNFIFNNWYEIEDKGYFDSFKIDKEEFINSTYSSVVGHKNYNQLNI
jgi:hypothetical protein